MKRTVSLLILFASALTVHAEKIDVVILTGSNNHKWMNTTPVLEKILEQSGTFTVDVVTEPEQLTAAVLAKYDVLLSNWNAYGKEKPVPWSAALRTAYVEFVRNCGGHVVVHAGSASFPEWDDYQKLSLATWEKEQTGHGPRHEFEVRMTEADHPVAEGLEDFRTNDELWYRAAVQLGATVLTEAYSKVTKNWEPSALAGWFGKGRCFTLLLGHGAEKMQTDGFQTLLLRGAEWAADSVSAQSTRATSEEKPNILFIAVDDLLRCSELT